MCSSDLVEKDCTSVDDVIPAAAALSLLLCVHCPRETCSSSSALARAAGPSGSRDPKESSAGARKLEVTMGRWAVDAEVVPIGKRALQNVRAHLGALLFPTAPDNTHPLRNIHTPFSITIIIMVVLRTKSPPEN